MTTRGRLGEDHSTKQDDSTRLLRVITRIPKVVRAVCQGHLFCELCWRVNFLFIPIIWNVQSIIHDIYGQSIVLLIMDTFHFISFSIRYYQPSCLPIFVTWMIMVLMVLSILFQDQLTAPINIHALSLLAFIFFFPPSNVYKRLFKFGEG